MFPEGGKPGFAKNIRVVEWLKADLISSTAALFKAMLKGSEEKLLDALSGLIINCYVLGRRMGISYARMDVNIETKLKKGIEESHEVEKWYQDLSQMLDHLTEQKR